MVGNEAKRQSPIAITPARFLSHAGPEPRPADSDIDDVPNPLSGVAAPCAASNLSSEIRHLFENRMNIGNDIFSIDDNPFPLGRSKRDVQHRAAFRKVDLLASKHGIDP